MLGRSAIECWNELLADFSLLNRNKGSYWLIGHKGAFYRFYPRLSNYIDTSNDNQNPGSSNEVDTVI